MNFEVVILGSSSATPIYNRRPTSQIIYFYDHVFLVDCGEGTLIQMNKYRIKFHRINHVFISHLHGDHYLGIMGVISTLHLQGRTEDLHLYSPPELKEIIEVQLKHSQTDLRYKLIYHFIDPINPAKLFEDADVEVSTIILNHRIPCTGFLFKEKPRLRKLKKEAISMYKIPVSAFEKIKAGEDYKNENGEHIPNSLITALPKTPRSYAFCSDTVYDERIASFIQGIDLLYHEATFANDKAGRAIETFHCTAEQAATIAKISRVRRLIIGHFSARYKNLYPLLEEAKLVFQNTSLAQEGDRFKIDYKEDNG